MTPRPRWFHRIAGLLLATMACVAHAQPLVVNWTGFRGPDQARAGARQGLPLHWSESSNIVWKVAVPDYGHSSPVVDGQHVYLTGGSENGLRLGAACFSRETGRILWSVPVFTPAVGLPKHARNSHASPTPAVESGRLYVAFGSQGVACLDTSTGAILWKNHEHRIDHDSTGTGSSPMLHGDLLVLNFDGVDSRSIVALRKSDGSTAWKTARSNPITKPAYFIKAHSTPTLCSTSAGAQWISGGSFRVHGYNALDGRELWSLDTPGFCPVPAPVTGGGMAYVCTGFDKAQLWAIRIPHPGEAAEVVWKHRRGVPLVSTPVLAAGRLFLVSDGGVATCLDAATGSIHWEERLGGNHWASPLAADRRVYFFNQEGQAFVVEAADQIRLLATNRLDSGLVASPAVSGASLFLRTETHLYRVGQQP
jgi:outer membrane protein assembly factor BamB